MKSAWFSMITVPNFNSNKGHSDFDMWKSNTFPWRPVTPPGGFLLFSLSAGLRQDVDASAVRLHRRRVLFFGDIRGWESSRFQVAVLRLEFADTDMEVATHYPLAFVGVDCYFAEVWIVLTVKAKAYKLQDPHKRLDLCGSLLDLSMWKNMFHKQGFAFFKIHLEQLAAHQPDQSENSRCQAMEDRLVWLQERVVLRGAKVSFLFVPESACEGFFVKKQPLYYIFTPSHLLIYIFTPSHLLI